MRFLRWLFDSESGERIEHPVLGEAVYFKASLGSYWEVEIEVAGKPFTLILDSEDRQEPTEAQVAFFQRFASNPQAAFEKVASMLKPAFESRSRRPLPADWTTALAFVGMSVPRTANEDAEYELSFEGPPGQRPALFACKLAGGVAKSLEVSS